MRRPFAVSRMTTSGGRCKSKREPRTSAEPVPTCVSLPTTSTRERRRLLPRQSHSTLRSGDVARTPHCQPMLEALASVTSFQPAVLRTDSLASITPVGQLIPRTIPRRTRDNPQIPGGAGGTRTRARRIMRSQALCNMRSTSTNDTGNRTDGTHHTGIAWCAGPQAGPRPRQHYSQLGYAP